MAKQKPKTPEDVRAILNEIDCGEYQFNLLIKEGDMFLQLAYVEPCIITGHEKVQKTRKWYISPWMVKNEIVQTALKAVLTSMEHRAREMFKYRGRRIYGPHFDVDALWVICGSRSSIDVRADSEPDDGKEHIAKVQGPSKEAEEIPYIPEVKNHR